MTAHAVPTPVEPPAGSLTAPAAPGERYEVIDVVRGFALFGVLLANLVWTADWFALSEAQHEAVSGSVLDHAAQGFVTMLIDYKFYTLFSMWFGLGFAMQMSRASTRNRNVLPSYVRRLSILFLIGAAHGTLLWFGDILHVYALLGFVLILFRNRSDRAVLGWALAIALLAACIPVLQWLQVHGSGGASEAARAEETARRFAVLTQGSYADVVRLNLSLALEDYTEGVLRVDSILHWYLNVFWKLLVGFLIGRKLLVQEASQHLGLFRRALRWALPIGLAGNAYLVLSAVVFGAWIPATDSALVLTWIPIEAGIFALSITYLCGLVLLYQRPRGRRVLQPLGAVGRMALTNYLSHSVLYVLLLYGVGLGLLGKVGTFDCLLLALAIFSAQLVASSWWLKRFRFGPAEWAWRSLSYGKLQPLRVDPTTT